MSFWDTEIGEDFAASHETEVDRVLNEETVVLGDLLECDELFQEVTAQNDKLIKFLSDPQTAADLITLMTVPPDLPSDYWKTQKAGYFSFLNRSQMRPRPQPPIDPYEPEALPDDILECPFPMGDDPGSPKEIRADPFTTNGTPISPILPRIIEDEKAPESTSPIEIGPAAQPLQASDLFGEATTTEPVSDPAPPREDDSGNPPLNFDDEDAAQNEDEFTFDADPFKNDTSLQSDDVGKLGKGDSMTTLAFDDEPKEPQAAPPVLESPKAVDPEKPAPVERPTSPPGKNNPFALDSPSEDAENPPGGSPNSDNNPFNEFGFFQDSPPLPEAPIKRDDPFDQSPPSDPFAAPSGDAPLPTDPFGDPTQTSPPGPSPFDNDDPKTPPGATFGFDDPDDLFDNGDTGPPPELNMAELECMTPPKEDPEVIKKRSLIKHPFMAAELLRMNVDPLHRLILNPETGLLEDLFLFLNTGPDEELDPVFAGYFSNTIQTLYSKDPQAILAFIKSSKSDLIGLLSRHIGIPAILELIGTLAWENPYDDTSVSQEINRWLKDGGFINSLVVKLQNACTLDEQSLAHDALVDIMQKSPMQERTFLMEEILSKEAATSMAGLALPKTEADLRTSSVDDAGEKPAEEKEDEPAEAPPAGDAARPEPSLYALKVLTSLLHLIGNGFEEEHVKREQAKQAKQARRENQESSDSDAPVESSDEEEEEEDDGDREDSRDNILEATFARLDVLKSCLDTPPGTVIETPNQRLDPPFGRLRLAVVELLMAFMRSACGIKPKEAMNDSLASSGIMELVVKLFFQYPWHNLLHGVCEHIVRTVLHGTAFSLKKALLVDAGLLERIIESFKQAKKENGEIFGYGGQVARMANLIESCRLDTTSPVRDNELIELLTKHEAWVALSEDELAAANKRANTKLA